MPTPHEALSAALANWNAGDLDGYLSLYDERVILAHRTPVTAAEQPLLQQPLIPRGFEQLAEVDARATRPSPQVSPRILPST